MIDNYIADQSPRITMTLSEILANTPPVQTLAQATDVPGTNLEWMKTAAYLTGAWYGDLGELGTTGFRDSLFTGYLARGVTCKVSGVPYSWGGAGWVNSAAIATASTAGAVKPGPGNRVLADGQIVTKYPTHVGDFVDANIWDGVIAFPGKYVQGNGTFGTLASYGVSSKIPVTPGMYYMCRTASTGPLGGGYYDASDNFIQALNRYAGGVNSNANICVTRAPANAAYIYLTIGSTPAYLVAGVFPVALGRLTQKATTKVRGYGTSITKGVQGTLTGGYITLLASKLGASLVNMGGDGTCFVTGFGNGCISDTLLATVVPCNPMPDLLIIEGPVNDFKHSVPLGASTDSTNATFLGALNVMAAYIAANFPTTKIAWVADPYYLNAGIANSLGLKMVDYVAPFRQKALDMGFVYVDCFNQLSFLYSDTYNNIWTYDGIHPGDMGCDAMANLVLQAIGE